jgi:glycosyltransferase involved in cell wall biosynthesis
MEGIAWALAWRLPNLWLRLHSPMWEGFAQGGRPASYRDAWVRRLDRITARRAANLVTHSAAHAEAMRRELRLGDRRIHLVPHGIVDPGLTPEVGRIPGRLLAIGPLWPRKGADVLLEAFVAVVRQHPQASLTMVGPTPDPAVRSQLEGLRAAHPALAGRVVLTGRLDERQLEREWRAAEVVVMASRYESFGLVAVEAMARGVPLVTSQAGSLPEVTGDAALHATTGDPGELAVRIAELLGDATLRRHLATLGRQRYLHSFTRADMGARLLATFTNLPDHA